MTSFSDDKISPQKAVDELVNRVYTNAEVERMHIEVDKLAPVGHLRFFKEQFKDYLWTVPVRWFNELDICIKGELSNKKDTSHKRTPGQREL